MTFSKNMHCERTISARRVILSAYERSSKDASNEPCLIIFGCRQGSHFGTRRPKIGPFWTHIGDNTMRER